ncbi:vacuolar membrane protein [Cordyceps fumosorosea ARSEF 2679]|uniref:Vacuolar membrane protein n=1 Tax=Cordyceps fumosorosea (strain ARSEF 2679) TaxID=1081104 RepID=A0A168DFK6_CORFA|nr:vacuolar membrane protein [Cordyceps fumosorosea ARSEF 2679]OAA72551.1 vacuolar membrane protein [Cordyceps fumosorosea ARSEF 2679]
MVSATAMHASGTAPDIVVARFSDDVMELEEPAAANTAPAPATTASPRPISKKSLLSNIGLGGYARRTLGICLLIVVVFLWTLSNFLASFIFSDHTYDKPFFVVYINTSLFAISLIPMFVRYMVRAGINGLRTDLVHLWRQRNSHGALFQRIKDEEEDAVDGERLLSSQDQDAGVPEPVSRDTTSAAAAGVPEKMTFGETAYLSLEFCMLWFLANYFASACLEYTSVASVTILTSTSSIWTLVFCALFKVESFSLRKLFGVLASLIGIVLISTVDLTGNSDEHRGSFPHKTTGQIAIGDSMALISAVVYGMYVTVMKRRVGDEDKVDMRLFFGLVGVFNLLFLWPLFFVLHWTGIEPFQLPPTGTVWAIIIANSLSSFISDIFWAFAMLLTTPLVVTVGLSLTIPLSLIGEMIQYGQYSSFVYWIGAAVVFLSFVFVSNESQAEEVEEQEMR